MIFESLGGHPNLGFLLKSINQGLTLSFQVLKGPERYFDKKISGQKQDFYYYTYYFGPLS